MKVLIVDDNADFNRIATRVLKNAGFEVMLAAGRESAVGICHYFHPQIVLLDMEFYGAEGIAFCRELKRDPDTAHIRIILMTGFKEPGEPALNCPSDAVVHKPFSFAELVRTIRTLSPREI
ncbi:MAG TPA: response regulator [Chitinophagaceae bacterium]|jgi:DNA-binding response OmpR family regulator|nr:response regulator [Chitinophagaceae bacterium]